MTIFQEIHYTMEAIFFAIIFQLLLVFFTSCASDDSSQDYRNKVIGHFHWVNIDVLSVNALGTPKAQFLLLVKIPQDV